jgi:hypothetical protein
MTTASRGLVALLLLIAPLASAVEAQTVPLRDLPRGGREIDDPFTLVSAARERRAGQLIVADGSEGEVALLDFTRGTRQSIGRKGAGPGEYQIPTALLGSGDTIWVMDGTQQRLVVFLPDLKPGPTYPVVAFDQQSMTALSAPMLTDRRGRLYASTMKLSQGSAGMIFPDSVQIVRFDPRVVGAPRTTLAMVRSPSPKSPQIRQDGSTIHMKIEYPGLIASDAWAVFADGRIAIVRGGNYSVQFLGADGTLSAPKLIPHQRIPVTPADRTAEMDAVRRQIAEQNRMMQRMMPNGAKMEIEVTPPAEWPSHFPAISALGALAAPDGNLWVRRAIPDRDGRQQWEVISPTGTLLARWRLADREELVAIGLGAVYTTRRDEDDLRYVRRVELPR